MQCNVCKGWNTEHGQCWDCHCDEVMREIERDFKIQNRWWKRLWRWIRRKPSVIDVTQYSTYSEPQEMPTLEDLLALAETLPPPPPKVNCVKHGRVAGTYPNKNMTVYCSICIEEWKLEFANQFSYAETVADLRPKHKFENFSIGCEIIVPKVK